ncbi:MAG: hypothetical protein PHD67_00940 [Oscillospiraceae bacterium]|nr:hypothetical protein [Oscillospiraceae bacterium]
MKRVKSACIQQTLHFQLKEELGHDAATRAVREEYEHYKRQLEQKRIRYKITGEETQPDGSIVIKIIKQYNRIDVGNYLD